MTCLDTSSLWSVQQPSPNIALVAFASCLTFLLEMTKSIKCQCQERGCIQDVLFRWYRRNSLFVFMFCADSYQQEPIAVAFSDNDIFPRTPSKVVWPVLWNRSDQFVQIRVKPFFHFLWICLGWCICAYGGSTVFIG